MYLRYGSEPFKCYASQAVMAQLLTPSCKFVKRLLPDEPVRAYLFRDTERTVGIVWAPEGTAPRAIKLGNAKLQLWDIMGRPQTARTFTPSAVPMYVVGEGVSPEDTKSKPIQLLGPKLEMCDIMGRSVSDRVFTPSASPVYITGEDVSPEDFEKAVGTAP
jgi:hypothetical protein